MGDGKVFSLSGNSTLAGSGVFLNEPDASIAQSFGVYYDSEAHPGYTEADLFSKAYRTRNKEIMAQQAIATGIHSLSTTQQTADKCVYYSIDGMKVETPQPNRIYIMHSTVEGKTEVRKVMFK